MIARGDSSEFLALFLISSLQRKLLRVIGAVLCQRYTQHLARPRTITTRWPGLSTMYGRVSRPRRRLAGGISTVSRKRRTVGSAASWRRRTRNSATKVSGSLTTLSHLWSPLSRNATLDTYPIRSPRPRGNSFCETRPLPRQHGHGRHTKKSWPSMSFPTGRNPGMVRITMMSFPCLKRRTRYTRLNVSFATRRSRARNNSRHMRRAKSTSRRCSSYGGR